MVFRNILYKEWKFKRRSFLLAVLAATLVSAFLDERYAAWIILFLLLPWCSIGLAVIFGAEVKTIDFLDSKPITRTNLWAAKMISVLGMWAVTICIILTCHFLLAKGNDPSFSIPSVLLNPHFFFVLLGCLALYSLGVFVSMAAFFKDADVKWKSVAGLIILGVIVVLWLLVKYTRLTIGVYPFTFRHETLSLFLTYVASVIVFTLASYLAFIHRETFSAGIRRRKIVYCSLGMIIVVITLGTLGYLVSIPVFPCGVKFINDIVVSPDGAQVAFSGGRSAEESQTWLSPIRVRRPGEPDPGRSSSGPNQGRKRRVPKRRRSRRGSKERRIGDRFSTPIAFGRVWDKYELIWMSHGWMYGPEIWIGGDSGVIGGRLRLSEKDYRYKVYVGRPDLSPAKDRIAYVKKLTSRRGSDEKKYLTIASVDGFEVPYPISGIGNFDISPIGWAPNADHFYFRKVSYSGEKQKQDSLWAIDRNAQAIQVIIEDFSGYQMDHRDLAEHGDWVSLVSEEAEEYSLLIMNATTNEKMKVDISRDGFPVRAWSAQGHRFAYVKRDEADDSACDFYVLEIGDGGESILVKSLAVVSEVKWSPDEKRLLFRTVTDEGGDELRMMDVDDNGRLTTIMDKIPERLQYEWVDSDSIVYAKDGNLMHMSISELRSSRLFP